MKIFYRHRAISLEPRGFGKPIPSTDSPVSGIVEPIKGIAVSPLALSLDFWGTLAVFNPNYSAARASYLADVCQLPEAEVVAHYQSVKRDYDACAERSGFAVTPEAAFVRLRECLSPHCRVPASELQTHIEALVRRFPPVVAPRTTAALRAAAGAGLTICLASNTNFIGGRLLTELFADWPLSSRIYSDELGVSKPEGDFFAAVAVAIGRHVPAVHRGQIAHIGDHPVCDRDGAEAAGMTAVLVRSPADTAAFLEQLVATVRRKG